MDLADPARVAASIAALLGAVFMGLLALLGTLFSVPPPERRHVLRAFADFATGIFGAWLAGYMLAAPAADFLNGLAAKIVPGFASIDSLAAGLLVGSVVCKLWSPAVDWLAAWLKRRTEGKTA